MMIVCFLFCCGCDVVVVCSSLRWYIVCGCCAGCFICGYVVVLGCGYIVVVFRVCGGGVWLV